MALFDIDGKELPGLAEMGKPLSSGGSGGGGTAMELTATAAPGNGSNGTMFDINAMNEVTITAFKILAKAGTFTVEVYERQRGYSGSETNPSAWK